MLDTAAKDSHLGNMIGSLDVWQMESPTDRDRCVNHLAYRTKLRKTIIAATGLVRPDPRRLQYDPNYGKIMCWVSYLGVHEALPHSNDIQAKIFCWKRHYNTELGKGGAMSLFMNAIC